MLHVEVACGSCPVQLRSRVIPVDLLVFVAIRCFDPVFEIGWLCHMMFDCEERTMTFCEADKRKLVC